MKRFFSLFVAAFLVLSVVRPALAQVAETTTVIPTATVGDLVKCPDFSSVYYLGEDGKRYVFPNENVFYSWYDGFDAVVDIACDDMAELALGGAATYQAGSTLLKLQSDPTVYAVEEDGVLRELESEDQAEALYGDDWAEQVDDLPDGFFGQYEVGEALADGEVPDGMIVTDDEGDVFRAEGGSFIEMDELITEQKVKILSEFSEHKDDVETRFRESFEIELTFTEFSEEAISALLNQIMSMLSLVDVSSELEVEIEIEGLEVEVEDESEDETEDSTDDSSDDEEETDEDEDGLVDEWEVEWEIDEEAEDAEDDASDDTDDDSDDTSAGDDSSDGSDDSMDDSSDDSADDSNDDSSDDSSGDSSDDLSGGDSDSGSDSSGGSDD